MKQYLARAVVILSVLAWIGGFTLSELKALQVLQVRCGEHGELIDLARDAGDVLHDHGDQDFVVQDQADPAHDHAVSLQGVPVTLSAVPQQLGHIGTRDTAAIPFVVTVGAPRGPPLVFAPKTSPPRPV